MGEGLLTSGQISGMAGIGKMSLYHYVKDFPEFFTDSAKKHKKGRRWSLSDFEVVQAIRYLYHERKGKEFVRETLAAGWRPAVNPAYSSETLARLINQVLSSSEQSEETLKDAHKAIKRLKDFEILWTYDRESIRVLSGQMGEVQKKLDRIQLAIKPEKKGRCLW